MAFQRPFLISLRRGDPREPWGFRLIGGTSHQPQHLVLQVGENSLSERCGLREGDDIIQIGRVNVQSLSHQDVQELIVRCKDRVELFIIREDPLRGRKENEPPSVKAVVHSSYNSPLQLYSTENVADTLALQTTVLTQDTANFNHLGPQSPPVVLNSDVFKVIKEQEGKRGYFNGEAQPSPTPPPRNKQPPPPPPKPSVRFQDPLVGGSRPSATTEGQQFQQERSYQQTSQTTQRTSYQTQQRVQSQQSPQLESQFKNQVTFQPQPQANFQKPAALQENHQVNRQENYDYETQRVEQTLREQQLQEQQYREQQAREQQFQQQLQQQKLQREAEQQQQRTRELQAREQQQQRLREQQSQQEQFSNQQRSRGPVHPGATPLHVKTKESFDRFVGANNQKYSSTHRMTPSPMGSPVVNRRGEVPVWPPQRSSVRDVPKTGFSPGFIQDKCSKKFTWPPPKEYEQSPIFDRPPTPTGAVANAWHPSDSPAPRSLPFARSPTPTRRTKDIQWPPAHSLPKEAHRHSPRVIRRATGSFDDYIQQHASVNVPPTYRTPPGTQHVDIVYEDM